MNELRSERWRASWAVGLRRSTGRPRESGSLLLDPRIEEILPGLHGQIRQLPGVLETGLFESYAYHVVN